MRVKIREQLSILVTFLALCCVGIPSLISWLQNYNFVVGLRTSRLGLVASLKADQLAQAFAIYQNSISSVSSRILIQFALDRYNNERNSSASNWVSTITDIAVALDTQPFLLQAVLWNNNLTQSLVNVTCERALGINGITNSSQYLAPGPQPASGGYSWNGHEGFPDELYPRSSIPSETDEERRDLFTPESILQYNFTFQGPVQVNETLYLASFTVPIFDQSILPRPLLGFFTIVVDAKILVDVANKPLGLDETGIMLVVGPDNPTNLWSGEGLTSGTVSDTTRFRFTLPAPTKSKIFNESGPMSAWRTVIDLYHNSDSPKARTQLRAANTSSKFSVGYIYLKGVPYLNWGVVIAQSYDEVLGPVVTLRKILLATIFGTCGVVILLVWPLAHCFVRPITRLSHATQNSKTTRSYTPDFTNRSNHSAESVHDRISPVQSAHDLRLQDTNHGNGYLGEKRIPDAFRNVFSFGWLGKQNSSGRSDTRSRQSAQDDSRNTFRIPSKVPERKHLIHDELTDLTHKFNRMTEELEQQYENLEDRVRERTIQLEEQRQIAETANEAKSRFIANITHELRTPLNGILGMCAVCLADDDVVRIKQSLGIVYKSGELLLHLLTDLLTFSKTQISGHAVALDLKRFRISDITSQVLAIFDKQARDNKIVLGVHTIPDGTLHDMILLGDSNRILQVIINLIGNALKFTPENGQVTLTITLGNEVRPTLKPLPSPNPNSRASSRNRPNTLLSNRSISNPSISTPDTKTGATIHTSPPSQGNESRNRSSVASDSSVEPKTYMFEFRVQDTGPGIPFDQQQKVFEPFVQGELGLNKKYEGTGLGLSICKQLATLMSGTINLDSTVGEGSTFTLKIPLRYDKDGHSSPASSREGSVSFDRKLSFEKEFNENVNSGSMSPVEKALDPSATNAERLAALPQPRLVGLSKPYFAPSQENTASRKSLMMVNGNAKDGLPKNVRVLVAEDNKINQEVVLRMLKLEHIENVTLAVDGVEAVDKIKEAIQADQAFHIVFMDVQMPNLDGLESTRIIRELGYSAPIVALSALTEESNIKECLESGMNYFLPKPIRRPALKHVLRTYCAPIAEVDDTPEQTHEKKSLSDGAIPTEKSIARS